MRSPVSRRKTPEAGRPRRRAEASVAVDRPRTLRESRAPERPRHDPAKARRALSSLGLLLLLGASMAGFWYAFESDVFRVRTVTVRGASPAVQQAVEDAVAPGVPGVLGPNVIS